MNEPSVARMISFQAKPGSKSQVEAGLRKQMEWRREQKDGWRWLTWEYASGQLGRYTVATFGHAWSDFDRPSVSPWVEEINPEIWNTLSAQPPVVQYYDHAEEISSFGAEVESPAMAEIAIFQLRFGKTAAFYQAVRQFHVALQKVGSPARYEWFELLSGDDGPQFLLFLPRRDWNDFNTPRGFLGQALEKSLGKRKTRRLYAQFNAAVKCYRREAIRLRPDLSCLAASSVLTQP